MDFHYGQALGFLRHFISVFGPEDGPAMYVKLVGGCGNHLKVSVSKAISQSSTHWLGEELLDIDLQLDGMQMDQST